MNKIWFQIAAQMRTNHCKGWMEGFTAQIFRTIALSLSPNKIIEDFVPNQSFATLARSLRAITQQWWCRFAEQQLNHVVLSEIGAGIRIKSLNSAVIRQSTGAYLRQVWKLQVSQHQQITQLILLIHK